MTSDTANDRISFAPSQDQEAAIDRAEQLFVRDGVVVLDDVVDPALAGRVLAHVETAHPEFETVDVERNYGPYPLRHVTPVTIAGPLAEREILLPRSIGILAGRLLGSGYEFDSLGVLVSLPGAPQQPSHPDARLFPETKLDRLLPTFACALAIPLMPMDEISGTTAFWRGSHRKPEVDGEYDLAPLVPVGSALLWDFRTIHCGLANVGKRSRPIIFTVLARGWFGDLHPPEATRYETLVIDRTARDGLSDTMRRRIRRARIVE